MKILITFLILFTFNIYLSIYILRKIKKYKDENKNNINIYCFLLVGINIVTVIYILYLLYENKIDIVLKK